MKIGKLCTLDTALLQLDIMHTTGRAVDQQDNLACPIKQPDSRLFNRQITYHHYASGQPVDHRAGYPVDQPDKLNTRAEHIFNMTQYYY